MSPATGPSRAKPEPEPGPRTRSLRSRYREACSLFGLLRFFHLPAPSAWQPGVFLGFPFLLLSGQVDGVGLVIRMTRAKREIVYTPSHETFRETRLRSGVVSSFDRLRNRRLDNRTSRLSTRARFHRPIHPCLQKNYSAVCFARQKPKQLCDTVVRRAAAL